MDLSENFCEVSKQVKIFMDLNVDLSEFLMGLNKDHCKFFKDFAISWRTWARTLAKSLKKSMKLRMKLWRTVLFYQGSSIPRYSLKENWVSWGIRNLSSFLNLVTQKFSNIFLLKSVNISWNFEWLWSWIEMLRITMTFYSLSTYLPCFHKSAKTGGMSIKIISTSFL